MLDAGKITLGQAGQFRKLLETQVSGFPQFPDLLDDNYFVHVAEVTLVLFVTTVYY